MGGGQDGPGTCVTKWSYNPISGEDVTFRYCDDTIVTTPESNIHSECTRNDPHITSCFDVDDRKKCAWGFDKCHFISNVFSILPKNKQKQFNLRYHSSKVDFFVLFLGELKLTKRHFKI